ncbi:hypothetical protein [Streptomyces sp. N2A]|uniref:hypothetical protein n=1 Tax=Streptomyces sp. N2A TaxID=3073936 RepID=UPI002870A0C3|nr:hypothetical protein [Streptomyces sp. N2A]
MSGAGQSGRRQAAGRTEQSPRAQKPAGGRKRRRTQGDADRAYRQALGVAQGERLPRTLGTVSSAGAARGGRGASRKGKGQFS